MELTINLDEETIEKLRNLAQEDEMTVDNFIAYCIQAEDLKKHVIALPFQGPKRVRCYSSHCKETERRPTPGDETYEYQL